MIKRFATLLSVLVLSFPGLAASPLPALTKLPAKTALITRVDVRELEKAPGAEELLEPVFEKFRSRFKPAAKNLLGKKLLDNLNHVLLFSETPSFGLTRSFSAEALTAVYLSGEFGEQRVVWELEALEGFRSFDIDGTKVVSAPALGGVLFAFPSKEVILVANGTKAMASALRAYKGKADGLSPKSMIATLEKNEKTPFLFVLDAKGQADALAQLAGGVSLGAPLSAWFTIAPVTQGASTAPTHSRLAMTFRFATDQEAEVAWRTFNGLRMVAALNPDSSPDLVAALGKASVGAKGKDAFATFDLDPKTAAAIGKLIRKK